MQTTTDPRIYSVGECAAHRGIAYGLVAPLFEQGKVCATHLAEFGIGRYTGSQTSTKLKVTGIDLFSAGNFMGGADTEEIVMSDPYGGVYKKLVIKDDKLVGACLYGDTVDGSWYFKLLRDGRKVSDIRDKLMFGESNIGDVGHQGHNKATAMADSDEVQWRQQRHDLQGHPRKGFVHARRSAQTHQGQWRLWVMHGFGGTAVDVHRRW
jgi:nitrite reductase (NADH) large subunit